MKTEFTTFRVRQGKEDLAREWMQTLEERRHECVDTLPQEKMVFESVFMLFRDGRMYLSWFSLQKEGHMAVETSDHEIDRIHLAYWHECIDTAFDPEDHAHVVSFIPADLQHVIDTMYDVS